MSRKCPRTIDKAILLFGLELEDIAVLALVAGAGGLLIGPTIPGVIAIVGWVVLVLFKRDKPPGYLVHWLYSKGFDLPGLITPLTKVTRYNLCNIQLKNNDRLS
jgi:hypothetical protein